MSLDSGGPPGIQFDGFEPNLHARRFTHHSKEKSGIARRNRYLNDLVTNSIGRQTNFVNRMSTSDNLNPNSLGPA